MPDPNIIEVVDTRHAEGLVMFRENTSTGSFLGITQRQHRERVDSTPWADIPLEITWVDQSGRVATKGDIYAQSRPENSDGTVREGTWQFIGRSGDMERLGYKRVAADRSGRTNANGHMVDPLGLLIVDEAGDPVTGPVSGEPQKHEWSGKVLDPEVLVP